MDLQLNTRPFCNTGDTCSQFTAKPVGHPPKHACDGSDCSTQSSHVWGLASCASNEQHRGAWHGWLLIKFRSTKQFPLEELNTLAWFNSVVNLPLLKNKIWHSGTQCISHGIDIIREGEREKEKERGKKEGEWKRGERRNTKKEKRKAYYFHFKNPQNFNVSAWVESMALQVIFPFGHISLFSICFK